jgi:phospholysine phosphohistidine inorganic pyrophosphate phosphatase
MPPDPGAYLFDLDGTLYIGDRVVPRAGDTLARLRERGVPFRFVSNTTSRPRAALAERLRAFGIEAAPSEIHTPLVAAGALLSARGWRSVAPFSPPASLGDLGAVQLAGGVAARAPADRPDAVLVGDLGGRWSYELLQEAFEYLLAGAALVALSRDRYFRREDTLALDAGPFVAALEYATGREATLVGKPSPAFFAAAIAGLRPRPDVRIAMVGDDLWSDIRGAQESGLEGWLVRTGKFRPDALGESGVHPDRVLDSIADVVAGIAARA